MDSVITGSGSLFPFTCLYLPFFASYNNREILTKSIISLFCIQINVINLSSIQWDSFWVSFQIIVQTLPNKAVITYNQDNTKSRVFPKGSCKSLISYGQETAVFHFLFLFSCKRIHPKVKKLTVFC